MDLFAKGILQGSVPVIVLVGGTHYFVKRFRESKPVLYWGSLAVATGAAIGIVTGRIPAPFMKAETEHECDYDCTCAHDDGVCAFDCIHCEDEKSAETFGADSYQDNTHFVLIHGEQDGKTVAKGHQLGITEKDGFTPNTITTFDYNPKSGLSTSNLINFDEKIETIDPNFVNKYHRNQRMRRKPSI